MPENADGSEPGTGAAVNAQTAAGDPPAVDKFDILPLPDAGKLIGQLLGLLAQISNREQSVAGNVRGFHQDRQSSS